jgi:hypothetical protein
VRCSTPLHNLRAILLKKPEPPINTDIVSDEKISNTENSQLADLIVSTARARVGGVRAIAMKLQIKDSQVVNVLKSRKVRLPLTNRAIKRIGPKKIHRVRKALTDGKTKYDIQLQYEISEWTLVQIELDQPGLNDSHRQRVARDLIEKHRNMISKILAKHPETSRMEINDRWAGAYEHLMKYDRDWFESKVPKQKRRYYGAPTVSRYDWDDLDKEKARQMKSFVEKYLNGKQKPQWITESRLLRKTGLIARYYQRTDVFPEVTRVLEQAVEPYEDFVQRKIKWAIEQFEPNEMLSVNLLRRRAGLVASAVRRYRNLVIEHAEKTGVKIHGGSFFAESNEKAIA